MEMLSREDAERRIRERAATDADFRAELLADPRTALESEFGTEIPERISVHVHEETLSEIHLVLPPADGALSEEELDMVAGGYGECTDDAGPP
jgi:hypothetical protein